MRAFQRLSLRFRIAAGVLAGLAILLSFFGLIALRTMDLSTQVALKERLRLAQISAASVDELLEHTARQLERTAVLVADREPDGEARVGVVYELLGEFDRIVRLSPEGSPEWIVPPAADLVWPLQADTELQAALGRNETSFVVPASHALAEGLLAVVITPIDGQDLSAGFLAGEVRVARADGDLLSLPPQDDSVRWEIVDAAGYIVAQPDGGIDRSDEHVEALAPMISSGQPGTTIHRPGRGADHVVAYYPFASHPGGVVIEQTEDLALVIASEMKRTLLVYGLVALGIATAAAFLHAHTVVRPIQRLAAAAGRVALGDLESPVAISRGDEIGELAQRFDEMRIRLRDSHEESARWAQELEHRVRERTRELDGRNRKLDALNRLRRQLLAKTISAQEEERKRLARELHDDSAQTLTAVLMTMQSAEDALPGSPDLARQALGRSRSQLELALREIRKAIVDLRPSALDDLGLASAVRWYADEHLRPLGIEVAFDVGGNGRQPTGAAATAIFRIAQEAVNNVARHSDARKARVGLDFGASGIVATIEDDGHGFDPSALQQPQDDGRGLGLLGMHERAELFGGTVEIESGAGKGTRVRVRVPYS